MWPNPQETGKILSGNLHFLCSVYMTVNVVGCNYKNTVLSLFRPGTHIAEHCVSCRMEIFLNFFSPKQGFWRCIILGSSQKFSTSVVFCNSILSCLNWHAGIFSYKNDVFIGTNKWLQPFLAIDNFSFTIFVMMYPSWH